MTEQHISEVLSHPRFEKRVEVIAMRVVVKTIARSGELDMRLAGLLYDIGYSTLRSIKSTNKLRGRRGFINLEDLATYMKTYTPRPTARN